MLQTIRLPRQSQRLAWLAEQLPALPGHGIIYTLTVRDAVQVAEWLRSRGLAVESYTGQTGDGREALEQSLLENRVKALGGDDRARDGLRQARSRLRDPLPDTGLGRGVLPTGRPCRPCARQAYGVLLSGEEETDITDYFITSAFPTRDEVRQVIEALEAAPDGGLSIPDLLGRVNLSSDASRRRWRCSRSNHRPHRKTRDQVAVDRRRPERRVLGAGGAPDRPAA